MEVNLKSSRFKQKIKKDFIGFIHCKDDMYNYMRIKFILNIHIKKSIVLLTKVSISIIINKLIYKNNLIIVTGYNKFVNLMEKYIFSI